MLVECTPENLKAQIEALGLKISIEDLMKDGGPKIKYARIACDQEVKTEYILPTGEEVIISVLIKVVDVTFGFDAKAIYPNRTFNAAYQYFIKSVERK